MSPSKISVPPSGEMSYPTFPTPDTKVAPAFHEPLVSCRAVPPSLGTRKRCVKPSSKKPIRSKR